MLPVGHRARPTTAAALRICLGGATAFTAFAWTTTQAHSVRAGSPWQADPYDAVVSLTEFAVPTLAMLVAVRMSLCRRDQPLPLFRAGQLLRAAVVCTVLVAMTVSVDWLAVILHAEHALWNATTLWLIAALAVLTGIVLVNFSMQRQALRLLPQHIRPSGDWLDDAVTLIRHVAPRVPGCGRLIGRVRIADMAVFIRRHVMASAAVLSLAAHLLVRGPDHAHKHRAHRNLQVV